MSCSVVDGRQKEYDFLVWLAVTISSDSLMDVWLFIYCVICCEN